MPGATGDQRAPHAARMAVTSPHRVRSPSAVATPGATLGPPLAAGAIDTGWRWVSELGAIGPGDRRARRFGAFGEGSLIAFPTGAVFNERWIRIGSDTMIGPYVSLSAGMAPGQEMVSDPVVSIGDRTLIGRGSHIVGHFCVEIGDDIQTGPVRLHHRPEPRVPGSRRPHRRAVAGRVERPHRIGQLARDRGGGAARAPHRPQRRRGRRIGGHRRAPRPLRRRRLARQGGEALPGRRRAGVALDQKLAGSSGLTAPKKKNSATSDAAPPTP